MKSVELRELTASELTETLDETKTELFNLRFQIAVNQSENTAAMGTLKRDIARIKTVIREQELAAWAAQMSEPEIADAEGGN